MTASAMALVDDSTVTIENTHYQNLADPICPVDPSIARARAGRRQLATGCAHPPGQPALPGATRAASRRRPSTGFSRNDRNYWTTKCTGCALKPKCTLAKERRVKRWEHEAVLDAMQERLERAPGSMRIRRQTAEHPFGTIKAWMGATHFSLRTLEKVGAEMSLHVLAYNLKRMIAILGTQPLIQAMRAA
jgi:hypothetical protein